MKAEVGTAYRHYKGQFYTVIAVGYHADDTSEQVVYQAEYDSPEFGNQAIWVRNKEEFEGSTAVNGKQTERFTEVVS